MNGGIRQAEIGDELMGASLGRMQIQILAASTPDMARLLPTLFFLRLVTGRHALMPIMLFPSPPDSSPVGYVPILRMVWLVVSVSGRIDDKKSRGYFCRGWGEGSGGGIQGAGEGQVQGQAVVHHGWQCSSRLTCLLVVPTPPACTA